MGVAVLFAVEIGSGAYRPAPGSEGRCWPNNAARHNDAMTPINDLLGPEPIRLPGDREAEAELMAGENPTIVAAAHPSASVAWAAFAEGALADDKAVTAYAMPGRVTTAAWTCCAVTDGKVWPGAVFARAQPRVFAVRGGAGPGGRRHRRDRRAGHGAWICWTTATRVPAGRSGSELSRVNRPGAVAGGSIWMVAWSSPRAASTARASCSTRAESPGWPDERSPCPCRVPASRRVGRARRSRRRPLPAPREFLDNECGWATTRKGCAARPRQRQRPRQHP